MNKVLQLRVLLLLSLFILIADGVRAQDDGSGLRKKPISITVENKSLFEVFLHLMYVYDVPVGFEESNLDRGHNDYFFQTNVPPDNERYRFLNHRTPVDPAYSAVPVVKGHFISLNFDEAPLENVMDEIVRQMRHYDWKVSGGVVNIYPKEGRDPRLDRLMSVRVASFGVSKGVNVGLLQPKIVYQLPEFKAFLQANKVDSQSDQNLTWYLDRPLPVDIVMKDLTFLQLLNGITGQKRGGWSVRVREKRLQNGRIEEIIVLTI